MEINKNNKENELEIENENEDKEESKSVIDRIEAVENEYENEIKNIKIRNIIITIILIIAVAIISSELTMIHYGYSNIKLESSDDGESNISIIAKTLANFRDVIDKNYIGRDEIDESEMLDETIKGYVNGLGDEYSTYMTSEEWEDFQADALGNYVGIGVYMSQDKSGNTIVLSPIDGSPAAAAGVQTGDIFISVNGENVQGMDTDEIANKVKGEAGTIVQLQFYRDGEYLDFSIERKEIKIYHVTDKVLDNNIGYIRLDTFDTGCANEIKNAIEEVKTQGANSIILDLRNNTGGLVDEALQIADFFLEKDAKILITKDANGKEDVSTSSNDSIIGDMKVVVLVNEYSASASEILTGALKDNGVATIVGTKTYGKGVIQSVYELGDGSALKLTTAEYYTPNNIKINKIGITPDYEVELNEETEDDEQLNKAIEVIINK